MGSYVPNTFSSKTPFCGDGGHVPHIQHTYLIDDMSLSYADVIRELAMFRYGVLAFTDSHFSTADAFSFINFCVLFDFIF